MRKQICEWLTLDPEMDLKPVLFYEKEYLGFENKILIWYNDYMAKGVNPIKAFMGDKGK